MASLAAAAREKSPEAFRTISEVAAELDTPQHVLRFWESRFAQIRPIKRAGGRRYYRPEDVDLLRGIRALLYREGFTIKGAQKVMRDKGLRHVMEIGRALSVVQAPFAPADSVGIEPRHARAIFAVVERAHPDTHDGPEPADGTSLATSLACEEQSRLEALLDELLQLKSRLRQVSSAQSA